MKKKKINWVPYAFIAPNLIGFVIFIIAPVLFSLVIAFTDFNIFQGFSKTSFVGLDNFINMFQDELFWGAVKNNIVYTIITIPISMGISIVLANILNSGVFCKTLIRVMIFLPYVASVVAISVIWAMLFNPSQGIINQILMAIGIANPPKWLGSMEYSLPALMIVGIWMTIGYNTIIYLSGLQGISRDLYEAAKIDGSNELQTFRYITIPMLRNTTFFLTVTGIITSFQVFGTVKIMTDGGPGNSTSVLAHYIYISGFRFYKMGYAAAMAWFLLVVILIITLFQWKSQKKFEDDF